MLYFLYFCRVFMSLLLVILGGNCEELWIVILILRYYCLKFLGICMRIIFVGVSFLFMNECGINLGRCMNEF